MANKRMNNPDSSLGENEGKDKYFKAQTQVFYTYLQEHTATASMVTAATGIPQKNICRFKRKLEKAGRLWQVDKKLCRHTGFKAWYLTTNPDLITLKE